MNIEEHLGLLGMRVEDRISGLAGVVTSVGFDLYGCIQATVHPGVNNDGSMKDQIWLDVCRLKVLGDEPVMARPSFNFTPEVISSGGKGPADRPKFFKW
jgi:hypothetical protein